jgi:copper chaperone
MRGNMSDASQRTYVVEGMSCEHCRAAVLAEVSALPEASEVEVELDTGRLTVRGRNVDDESVRAAVSEAGYEVVA